MVTTAKPFVGVPPFERSPTTNLLIEEFVKLQPGEMLTYDEISALAGCTRDAWRGCMGTAKKVLIERYNIKLLCQAGVGYYHAADDELGGSFASKRQAQQHSQAKRTIIEITRGIKDSSKLPHAKVAAFQLVVHATSSKVGKLLESKAKNGQLTLGDTIEVLRRLGSGK